ncbi:excinuclease ABC subunit UvrA [Thermodesulfovibrio sp.]|uniref:excinuclease ABC subunit UvrA n=1 Tax=Thermodesulfovibrio sp. TaxID=2067987 RepID=UPI0030A6FFAF
MVSKEKEKNNLDTTYLIIKGARQNNLKNIDLIIPHNKLTVITGVSGSGKSSLAFDTIYAEGQWRFIECMSSYARVFIEKLPRPQVDLIENLRPAIALEQRNPVKGSRATVGTHTEIYDYLRLIFSKIAKPVCPKCNREIKKWSTTEIAEELFKKFYGKRIFIIFHSNEKPSKLMKEGFSKFMSNDTLEIKNLEDLKDNTVNSIDVITDRLKVYDKARLIDSLEIAFKRGTLKIFIPDEKILIPFSQETQCPICGFQVNEPSALLFSFNHPHGACHQCKGFGYLLSYDENLIIPDRELSLKEGAIEIFEKPMLKWWKDQLIKGAKLSGIDVNLPYRELPEEQKELLFTGNQYFYGLNDFFEELEKKKYKVHVRVFLSRMRKPSLCPNCKGKRLKESALIFKINGFDVGDLNFMTVNELKNWIESVLLSEEEFKISEEPFRQIKMKLDFLKRVGLDYLTMDRQIKTLSGGEYQRVNIANQLSNRLTSTLYVLDEPTVGLHPRDTDRIIDVLKELTEYGNTVVVVEHDREVISQADWIVELGPGGGKNGGNLVFAGDIQGLKSIISPTANYLKKDVSFEIKKSAVAFKNFISLKGAKGHNLKNVSINIPLNAITVVTGVSGSGKSSLIIDTLYKAIAKRLGINNEEPLSFEELEGLKNIKAVKLVDQSPIGKTPKSIPVTYLEIYGKIREIFASQKESKLKGFSPGHFSLNSASGHCPSCKGEGFIRIEMFFFEDLFLPCEECKGRRFREEVLEIKYKERNIYDVLNMTFDEAFDFFEEEPSLREKIRLIKELGLGYLLLGQPATTLSGGEAQRLKICAEILNSLTSKRESSLKGFLYILDEPTVGLHHDDVQNFIKVIDKLIDKSATVVIIEHNPDVIIHADWIIDIGPEGGHEGGRILYEGVLYDFLKLDHSHTARYLRKFLKSQ